MGLKDDVTKRLWKATSDNTKLNKQALKLKRSFDEANKALDRNKKKKEK